MNIIFSATRMSLAYSEMYTPKDLFAVILKKSTRKRKKWMNEVRNKIIVPVRKNKIIILASTHLQWGTEPHLLIGRKYKSFSLVSNFWCETKLHMDKEQLHYGSSCFWKEKKWHQRFKKSSKSGSKIIKNIYVEVEYVNQSKTFKPFIFTPYFGDKVYNAVSLKNIS